MEIDQDQLLEEQDPLIPHSEIRPTTETQSTALLELPRAPTGNELKQKFMAYRVSDTSHRLDLLRVFDTRHMLDFIESLMLVIGLIYLEFLVLDIG